MARAPAAIAGGTKGATFLGYEAIGAEDIAGPRVAVTLFTDDTSTPPPPSSSSGSSSGGTTAPGDDDDTGPIAPSGDDDDGVTKKPSAPKPPPTKGATVKPGATSGASSDEGGCVAAPSGRRLRVPRPPLRGARSALRSSTAGALTVSARRPSSGARADTRVESKRPRMAAGRITAGHVHQLPGVLRC